MANKTLEGVYIYPDWTSCIKGRVAEGVEYCIRNQKTNPLYPITRLPTLVTGSWRHHVLEKGVFCDVIEVHLNPDGILSLVTQVDLKSPNLTYSPPNYHSFGVPPTQSDPFETNSVEV